MTIYSRSSSSATLRLARHASSRVCSMITVRRDSTRDSDFGPVRENVGHTIGVVRTRSPPWTLICLVFSVNAAAAALDRRQHKSDPRAKAPIVGCVPPYVCRANCTDTAGQERFRSVARQYYRGSVGALLCYDITRRSTFDSVAAWLADARALASPDLFSVLVGLKVR